MTCMGLQGHRCEYRWGDPNGIGKWHLGSKIAHAMGHGVWGAWSANRTSTRRQKKDIGVIDTIANIGAGLCYHTFAITAKVQKGHFCAVDLQAQILTATDSKKEETGVDSNTLLQVSEKTVDLSKNGVNEMLFVEGYLLNSDTHHRKK